MEIKLLSREIRCCILMSLEYHANHHMNVILTKKKQQANKQTKNRTMCLTYLLSVTITFPLSFPCLGPGNQSSRQAPWEGERGREPGAGDEEAGGAARADDRRGEGR